jgi:hypothetical protein
MNMGYNFPKWDYRNFKFAESVIFGKNDKPTKTQLDTIAILERQTNRKFNGTTKQDAARYIGTQMAWLKKQRRK